MATLFDEALKKAKAGNTEAQMFVAEMYFKGQGVMPSYIEALKWLEAAADKNKFASAQIAKMYREGIGVKKDLNKAFEIAVEYANKGNEIQMFELAGYYLNGIGVEANLDEALSWYEKAYNAGYLDAAYYLGYLYQTNNKIKDINKIIYWYNLAAEANNPLACYNLGYIYYDGTMVIKNNEKALEYLKKALSLGLRDAEALIDKINSETGYFGYSIHF
jgi:TPR repeat protein